MKRFVLSCAVALGLAGAGAAQEVSLAEAGLQKRIEALSGDASANGFELGMLQALRGIEGMMQTRYRYGMGDRLAALPMLRLELGQRNPTPAQATPETLSNMMRAVLKNLQDARTHLNNAASKGAITPFSITLQDIWFDVNGNGKREASEDVIRALAPILLGRQALRDLQASGALADPLTVRFDAADHAWLTAYTHMLSGVGNLFLAFDPAPVLKDLQDQRALLATAPEIPNTFDLAALAAQIEGLEQEREALRARFEQFRTREQALKTLRRGLQDQQSPDEAEMSRLTEEINRIRTEDIRPLRGQIRAIEAEISAAEAKLNGPAATPFEGFRNDIDTLYVLLAALRQQPDPGRVAATHDHWMQMIAQNRIFWAALARESDNENEWIPNPSQTSALPLQVSAEMAQSWQAILEDAQALLEGRLLIPHPLLPAGTGISLKAYADDPGPLDLLNWVHGIGAYRYAAKGPMITRARWLAFQRLTRGNAGGFALFFN